MQGSDTHQNFEEYCSPKLVIVPSRNLVYRQLGLPLADVSTWLTLFV